MLHHSVLKLAQFMDGLPQLVAGVGNTGPTLLHRELLRERCYLSTAQPRGQAVNSCSKRFCIYQLGRRHRFVLQLNSAQWILSHLVSIHVSFVLLLIPGLPLEILTVLLLFGCSKCSRALGRFFHSYNFPSSLNVWIGVGTVVFHVLGAQLLNKHSGFHY